ncbi:Tubulin--tyrosine ligase-like protein [Echinococcus granulosus]|uniref:Tubulin--tyrosine ligase-like protein n=1 Tax=Echinococcus granulosus TaxID=6210 RepID=W6VCS6_ECHGR|nr:Tubulin--tyrosine ligase-like protein [Echinococcus granulosus]EUB64719.1 Tubulin--tyrosine ligase-like protein [Echinococcus granulosus]
MTNFREAPPPKMDQYTYSDFLRDHGAVLISMRVPELYWPSVHIKLQNKIFDAPTKFELGMLNYTSETTHEVVERELFVSVKVDEVRASDSESVFLVDHAWTFELPDVRSTLESNATLLQRMKTMMCIEIEDESEVVEAVMRKLWKFCRLYQLSQPLDKDEEESMIKRNVWYILDEFGSSLKQSTTPNVCVASLLYVPEQLCYSLFWPIEDLHKEDTLYVDWLSVVTDEEKKSLLLIPWEGGDFSDRFSAHTFVLTEKFFTSHKIAETLPDPNAKLVDSVTAPQLVYTDLELVSKSLTSPNYKITADRDQAGIVWVRKHIRDYAWLSQKQSHVWLNQFPNESVLTVKDMLAALAASERAIEISGPGDAFDLEEEDEADAENPRGDADRPKRALTSAWYPVTFNLFYELAQFVGFFQRKSEEISDAEEEKKAERNDTKNDLLQCPHADVCLRCDRQGRHVSVTIGCESKKRNIWIVKPWNLGRGLGICISENLDQILRLNECGPMIASRYITDPVLFYRKDISSWVKFDLRYVVFLISTQPLRLYTHKVFWLRFANKHEINDYYAVPGIYPGSVFVVNMQQDCMFYSTGYVNGAPYYCRGGRLVGAEMVQVICHSSCRLHCLRLTQFSLDHFDDYTKHFTVMNYREADELLHIHHTDFIQAFEKQYPNLRWKDIERGLGAYGKSRAMYAVDLLLEWRQRQQETSSCGFHMEPQICEVNFTPDCTRACHYYPNFYNEVFDFLFLGRESEDIVQLLRYRIWGRGRRTQLVLFAWWLMDVDERTVRGSAVWHKKQGTLCSSPKLKSLKSCCKCVVSDRPCQHSLSTWPFLLNFNEIPRPAYPMPVRPTLNAFSTNQAVSIACLMLTTGGHLSYRHLFHHHNLRSGPPLWFTAFLLILCALGRCLPSSSFGEGLTFEMALVVV